MLLRVKNLFVIPVAERSLPASLPLPPSPPLCLKATQQPILFPLTSSSLQVKLSTIPSLLLALRSQEKWIMGALPPRCSGISSTRPSPAPSCCVMLPHSVERRRANPRSRSLLQVICPRRDPNPIMCTQKTLHHVQPLTGVPEQVLGSDPAGRYKLGPTRAADLRTMRPAVRV